MRKAILASIITVFLAVGLFSASGQAPPQFRGVLSILHAGQPVSLKESNSRYEIGIFENGPAMLGYKVLEVSDGGDYVVIEDISGVTVIRIPTFSIKSIVTMKLDGKKAK